MMHFGSVTQKPVLPAVRGMAGACLGGLWRREAARGGWFGRHAARWLRFGVFPARGVPSVQAGPAVGDSGSTTAGCANKNLLRPAVPSQAPMAPCRGRPNGREAAYSGFGRAARGLVYGSRLHAGASASADPFGKESGSPAARRFPTFCTCSNQALSRTPGGKGWAGIGRVDSQALACAVPAGRRLALR